jgi:crotonobetainyl-CoA:carnitine CoA-transferase CaiB-like acyl-CoA transferase
MTPCQLFPTADGWIFLMCNKEKFWPALCEKLGKPQWADDPRFRTFPDRLANRDEVVALLDGALKQRSTAEWLADFAGVVPAAPVLDVAEALDNPFVTEHGRLQTLEHPDAGEFRLVAPPVRSANDPPPANPAPALGGDTDDILGKLGYDEKRIEALRKDGVL